MPNLNTSRRSIVPVALFLCALAFLGWRILATRVRPAVVTTPETAIATASAAPTVTRTPDGAIVISGAGGAKEVLERPPVSLSAAKAMGRGEDSASPGMLLKYAARGPGELGFTQNDADWLLTIWEAHEQPEAKRIALRMMGFALAGEAEGMVKPTYDEATRQEMFTTVVASLESPEASVRRAGVSAVVSAQLFKDPTIAAKYRSMASDPDQDVAAYVARNPAPQP